MNRLQRLVAESKALPILGIAVYSNNPVFLEMATHIGFQVIWIEMEHQFITFAEAANLCRMAQQKGALAMIRVADTRRENVGKAAECGPDIIDVPMIESAEMAQEFVRGARFPPIGNRGYFSVSRSLDYGLAGDIAAAQKRLNEELGLMIQIETAEAVNRIDEICAVTGVEIFIGPSDLSASLGVPGQLGHPSVFEAAKTVIAAAKRTQKIVAVGASPAEFDFYAKAGVDLLFCGNDTTCMRAGIQSALQHARIAVEKACSQ